MQKVRKAHIPKIPTVTCSSHLSLSINARLLSYHSNNVFFFFSLQVADNENQRGDTKTK